MVTGPGAAPGAAILVPWPAWFSVCVPAAFDTLTAPSTSNTPSAWLSIGPAQKSVPRMPILATGVVTPTSDLASFDNRPDTKRNAPATWNLIVPRPAACRYTFVGIGGRIRAERLRRRAACPARVALDATDRADGVLRRGLAGG